jgi:protein gp37
VGENTKIEWADHSWNPWVGCTKVSAACDHCYAEGWAKRTGQPGLWQGERRHTSEAYWRHPLGWDRDAYHKGQRARVFCASLADVFDNQVPPAWRADLGA